MEVEFDLRTALGAEELPSYQFLSLYIPNKNAAGKKINTTPWIKEGGILLARMGGGVTITPRHRGGWGKEDGTMLWEETVIIYSYIFEDERFVNELPALRKFLHRFGRETDQGQSTSRFPLHICGVKPTVSEELPFNEQVCGAEAKHTLHACEATR